MVFTAADDAKPKVPHDEGLPCLSCGAMEASQWRGLGLRYCSKGKCKKAAKEAAQKSKATSWEDKLKQVDEDGDARDGRIAELEATLERRSARYEEQLSEQATELADQADRIEALTSKLARLSTQLANALPQSAGAGAKRPALGALPAQPVRR